MAHEKIVTLFDSATQAEAAKKNLIKAGFPDHDISLISGERLQSEGKAIRHPSIWQRLFGDTVDRDYADVYSEAMENGGVILSLRAAEDDVAKAMTILYSHDSVDVPSRARRDVETKADQTGQQREFAGQTNDTQRDPVRTSLTGNESEEEILRLAQEHLEVGKRLVSEGSTRVRRYVVTDQVTEQVSLHEQHADIFRRAIDEPAYLGDIDWSEKTIEVAESHEQPVINKTARVKEEVVVRKDINDRVETVNDTVRRQEVDIDKAAATTQPRNQNLNEAGASTLNSANATGTQASTVPGTNVNTSKLDNNATQGKPTLGEKVSEKVSEVKDKVEGKSKQQNYDHTH